MSKQLMSMTVRLSPEDKRVAFLRLDGVGIRQFEQLSIQYRRIHKIDTATKSEVIRWIIAQYTSTPCDLASLQTYCEVQHIGLLRLFELSLCVAMQKHLGKIV
jgi:hypothetical protein